MGQQFETRLDNISRLLSPKEEGEGRSERKDKRGEGGTQEEEKKGKREEGGEWRERAGDEGREREG